MKDSKDLEFPGWDISTSKGQVIKCIDKNICCSISIPVKNLPPPAPAVSNVRVLDE